jgi:hypothetical protein
MMISPRISGSAVGGLFLRPGYSPHLEPDQHDKAKAEKDLKRDVEEQAAETRVPEDAGGDTSGDRQKGATA